MASLSYHFRHALIRNRKPLMPTVLQILPELRSGGVERGTLEITRALTNAGWRALVVSAGGELVGRVKHAGGEHFTLPVKSKNPFTIIGNAGRIAALIREQKVDIVHARSRAPAWSAYLAAKETRCHFVTTFHGIYGLQSPLKQRYNNIMTKGERVIAVSHFVANHILSNYDIDPDKLTVIHRGVDLEQFSPDKALPQRMAELIKAWNLPDDGLPIILVPGRITRWKGQDVCLKALARLAHRNFHCILLGPEDGHERYGKELRRLVSELELEGRVRMVGNTPYMAEAYKLASIVVAPSVEPEAFGRVPAEAQAMGRPVIATRHGGACETVIDRETGLLVPPGDTTELGKAIQSALTMDNELRAQVEEQAIWNIHEHFSAQVMCDKTLALYQEVLSQDASR